MADFRRLLHIGKLRPLTVMSDYLKFSHLNITPDSSIVLSAKVVVIDVLRSGALDGELCQNQPLHGVTLHAVPGINSSWYHYFHLPFA